MFSLFYYCNHYLFSFRLVLTFADFLIMQRQTYVSVGHNWAHFIRSVEITMLMAQEIRIRDRGLKMVIQK